MHVLPSGALHRDVDDEFVLVAAAPMYLDRTVVVGEFGFEPDTFDAGRKHQLRVGTVHQAGDVNGGVEQCDRRRVGQLDVGVQPTRHRPA